MNNSSPIIRVVVVEDQITIRRSVTAMLAEEPGISVVGEYGAVDEAVEGIASLQPDLILLDIRLRDESGFEILDRLAQLPKVIFLTSYEQHALRAIKYGALDYLLKPVNAAELKYAISKVAPVQELQIAVARAGYRSAVSTLLVAAQQYFQVIELQTLLYCQGDAGYTTFYLKDGRKVVSSKHLKEYEEVLPCPPFVRSHQSYIVNLPFIDRYHKDGFVVLHNGTEIPVASRRRDEVLYLLKHN